jgi:hypothetical protein
MTMASPTTKGNTGRQGSALGCQARTAALVSVLDEDIRHVEATLVQLDTLRGLLIKRDDRALEKLLEEIHLRGEAYAATECRRQELRRELAAELGRSEGDLTLSELLAQLTGPDRTALAERQRRLKVLIAQLKREHTLTSLLISDCAKFNRSLLRVFFGPAGKTGTMYGSTGAAKHPTGTALLNMQL